MIDRARLRRTGLVALVAVSLLSLRTSAAAMGEQVVVPGERIVVNANGFRPAATVTLQLIPHPASQSTTANPGGHVQFLYVVPKNLTNGEYRLAIVGPARDAGSGPLPTGTASATQDPQMIEVTVPRVAFDPFRVGGQGVEAQPPIKRGGGGPIAFTGVPIEQLLSVGFGAILAGIVVLIGVRRRRRRV